MKYIDQIDLNKKTVFLRADLNVPLDENGKISDETRIKATLITLEYALKQNAKVILCSHLGRPKGKDPKQSLKPVAERIAQLLKINVEFANDCIGEETEKKVKDLKFGEVLLLENLRFYKEEEENDIEFAKKLARLAEVYVDDAFAVSHRAHASLVGMVPLMKTAAAGFTIKNEMEYFSKAFDNPERPLIAIFGGAKVSGKITAIKNVGKRANKIILGGAMANTFFAAKGLEVGKSLYEADFIQIALDTEKELAQSGCQLILPSDVIIAAALKSGIETKTVDINKIPADMLALDIGPKSVELFKSALADAKTIIWNGPMGAFETPEFASGTFAIVDILSSSKALTVVGGGDTDVALHQKHAFDKMSYVSTAGGAFLCLLEGKELPAVKALN